MAIPRIQRVNTQSGMRKKLNITNVSDVRSTKEGSDFSGFNYKHNKSPRVIDSILDHHKRDYYAY
jgi:hypothetical protein